MAGQLRLQPPLQDGVRWPCWLLGASRSLVLSTRRRIAIWLVSDPVVRLCHQSHLTVVPGAPCSIVVLQRRVRRYGPLVVGVSDAGSKVRFSAHIPKRMSHERSVAILRRFLLRRIFETQRPGRSYAVGVGLGRLVCGLELSRSAHHWDECNWFLSPENGIGSAAVEVVE
jgi:hypothetical protein